MWLKLCLFERGIAAFILCWKQRGDNRGANLKGTIVNVYLKASSQHR